MPAKTTPARTTPTINSVCSKCGIIAKSGKGSCCGRGGSWFRNCGSAGNTKLHHTWFEGIQACKARSQSNPAIDQQANVVQQENIVFVNSPGKTNSKAIDAAAKPFPSHNTLTPMSDTTPIIALAVFGHNSTPSSRIWTKRGGSVS